MGILSGQLSRAKYSVQASRKVARHFTRAYMTSKIKNLLILAQNVNVSRLPYAMNYTMIVDDLSFVRPQPALYGTENATCDLVKFCSKIRARAVTQFMSVQLLKEKIDKEHQRILTNIAHKKQKKTKNFPVLVLVKP